MVLVYTYMTAQLLQARLQSVTSGQVQGMGTVHNAGMEARI